MIDEKRIKRFIEGAKEAFKEVENKTFNFPMNILSAYELATSIEELLKEQEAEPPIHVHEEYPEHDWETDEDGKIDEWAMSYEFHNGPMCKRCYHSFCIHCEPNGFNDGPCVIDEYKCPKCGCILQKGTKFCSECGQAVKWEC